VEKKARFSGNIVLLLEYFVSLTCYIFQPSNRRFCPNVAWHYGSWCFEHVCRR